MRYFLSLCIGAIAILFVHGAQAGSIELLNVSYDPTREFYAEYNPLFAAHWKARTGQEVSIKQSHGGSGKQARSVMDGLAADVVTLALGYDIDAIAERTDLVSKNWQQAFAHRSSPYHSIIVLVVRKGNPKAIKDWADLVRDDLQVITPNPKTSGGARWNYLAAYGYALKQFQGDDAKVRAFMTQLYANVPVLDVGARGASITFAQRGIGDVLIAWENEAMRAIQEFGPDKFEIVMPSLSIRAEPSVAVVEKVADKKGTREVARAYLDYLYSPQAQKLIAKHFYRPSDPQVAAEFTTQFPSIPLMTIDEFGGWQKAQHTHFDDGGVFDQLRKP